MFVAIHLCEKMFVGSSGASGSGSCVFVVVHLMYLEALQAQLWPSLQHNKMRAHMVDIALNSP